jgi:hypothetical protein
MPQSAEECVKERQGRQTHAESGVRSIPMGSLMGRRIEAASVQPLTAGQQPDYDRFAKPVDR